MMSRGWRFAGWALMVGAAIGATTAIWAIIRDSDFLLPGCALFVLNAFLIGRIGGTLIEERRLTRIYGPGSDPWDNGR